MNTDCKLYIKAEIEETEAIEQETVTHSSCPETNTEPEIRDHASCLMTVNKCSEIETKVEVKEELDLQSVYDEMKDGITEDVPTAGSLSAKKTFNEKVKVLNDISSDRSFFLDNERYNKILHEVKEAQALRKKSKPLTSKQYRRLKRYNVMKIGDTEKLVEVGGNDDSSIRYYCKTEELFDVLEAAHVNIGHKRTRVMETELKKKYCNISRQVIDLFLTLCECCQLKKRASKWGSVVSPIFTNCLNSRGQVDLIDMQSEPDGNFQFILNYQDHLTKFTILRPLETKTAEEVAYHLMDIFCIFGAPIILQSDNGREFANRIIKKLAEMCPEMKLVHGRPRHMQSQGSVEQYSEDVRDMLVAWLADNNTKAWSEGLRFIQSKKNGAFHSGINRSPYEAMFGTAQRTDSPLTKDIETEEELEQLITARLCNNEEDRETPEVRNKESSGVYKCSVCGQKSQKHIERERAKQQAQKKVALSSSKFAALNIGTNAIDVDCGLLAPRSSELHWLGTKDGVVERLHALNAGNNFMDIDDVPSNSLSASMLTSGSKVTCNCKRYCIDKKCKCRSKNMKCQSKCHKRGSCKNK